MSSPQEMWEALPPLTRAWLGVSVFTTALVSFNTLSPPKLAFFFPLIVENLELWRVVTPFIFFGKFSFNFLIQMFILARFSSSVESDGFKTPHGGTADYLFALMLMGLMMLVIGWFMEIFFLGSSLVFAVLYLWSKKNPESPTSIWGFQFKGAQLPWALIAFNVLIGQSPIMDLLGVFVGHIYYYLVEVQPLVTGKHLIRTPDFLYRLANNLFGPEFSGAPQQATAPRMQNWGGVGRPLGRG